MGFWDKLFGEFVDVVEWTNSSADTMVYRYDRLGNEIKYGAKLTVREGQVAVFVNEGQIADVFEPGMYELKLTTCQFLQPFKTGHTVLKVHLKLKCISLILHSS